MMNELELLDHLNDTVTRITEDTLLLSLLLFFLFLLFRLPLRHSLLFSLSQSIRDSLSLWTVSYTHLTLPTT